MARLALLVLLVTVPYAAPRHGAAPVGEPAHSYIVGFEDLPPLSRGQPLWGGRIVETNQALRFVVVETRDAPALFHMAGRESRVRYVEPNSAANAAALTPDDPRFAEQYAPQQVRAPEVWDSILGSDVIGVCVVDTGIRYSHQEFEGRYRGGWDFVNDEPDPWDDGGHGTIVASVAVAGINDGRGIAGVANVGILAAKAQGSNGLGSEANEAAAIQWCADHDGDIINLSLGRRTFSQAEQDAVRYAWQKGSLIVAAAGNYGPCQDCIAYPAKLSEVIAATCTDRFEAFCHWEYLGVPGVAKQECPESLPKEVLARCLFGASSTGPESELAAPGKSILGACFAGDEHYCRASGTSFSSPYVAGVAALTWSQRPTLTNCQLREILTSSAADLGAPGRDAEFGFGRVDARGAQEEVLNGRIASASCQARVAPLCRLLNLREGMEPVGLTPVRVYSASATSAVTTVDVYVDGTWATPLVASTPGYYEGALDSRLYPDGPHAFEVRCGSADGQVGTTTRSLVVDQTPRPNVRVVVPEENGLVAGIQDVSVEAASNVGSPLRVLLRTNGGPWTDITETREGNRYRYLWDASLAPQRSRIEVQATDDGGVSSDFQNVRVVDSGNLLMQDVTCAARAAADPIWFVAGGCCLVPPVRASVLGKEVTACLDVR